MSQKSKKVKLIIAAITIAVLAILLSEFWIIPQNRPTRPSPAPTSTPTPEPIPSVSGYYLPYEGNNSRIFVVSANASYGYYPGPTRQGLLSGLIVVEHGEPCVIIDVVIRNDYSIQNPSPSPNEFNQSLTWVFLTAQLFSDENQINATDLTKVGMPASGYTFVNPLYGESANLTLYLGTNSTDVTSFQLIAIYIAGMPLP